MSLTAQMTLAEWTEQILSLNSLHALLHAFVADTDDGYTADRHVVERAAALPVLTDESDSWLAAGHAALGLLLDWKGRRNRAPLGVWISAPVLVLPFEWYSRGHNAPPPHVRIQLSKVGPVDDESLDLTNGGPDLPDPRLVERLRRAGVDWGWYGNRDTEPAWVAA